MNKFLKFLLFLLVVGVGVGLGYWYFTESGRLIGKLASFPVPDDPEEDVHFPPLQQLINMGTLGTQEILKRFDKSPIAAKVGMVIAAGRMRNTKTFPLLKKSLGVEEKKLNGFAAIALSRFGRKQAPTILKWTQDSNPLIQEYACKALGYMSGEKTIKKIAPELVKLLEHPNSKVQAQALIGLAKMNKYLNKKDLTPLTEHVGKMTPLLASEDPETSENAALAIMELNIPKEGGMEQIQKMKALLKSDKAYVRLNILKILAELFGSDIGVQDQLAKALKDPAPEVHRGALALMIKFGFTTHYKEVLPFLLEEDPELQKKLTDYLGSINDAKLLQYLEEPFKTGPYHTKFVIIKILKRIGKVHPKDLFKPLIPELVECMRAEDPGEVKKESDRIRFHAHETLRSITGAEGVAYSYKDWMEWYNVATSIDIKKKEAFQALVDAKHLIATAPDFPEKKNKMYRDAIALLKVAKRNLEEIKRFTNFTFKEQLEDIQLMKYQATKFLGNE